MKDREVPLDLLTVVRAWSLRFDGEGARAYGRIYAAVVAKGRKARGARAVDLLIAATACAARLPLYTRNPDDFRGLEKLVDVVSV